MRILTTTINKMKILRILRKIESIRKEIQAYSQLLNCLNDGKINSSIEEVFDFFEKIRCDTYEKIQNIIEEVSYHFTETIFEEMELEIEELDKTEQCPFIYTAELCKIIINFIDVNNK